MKRIRKQLLAVLLTICMSVSLLPTAAYAAIGDLLGNTAGENQTLMEELEALTG